MSRRGLVALALLALAACGGSPSEEQQKANDADAALLEATQAPLERAQEVQQTIDAHAAQMEADAAAAMEGLDPNADPDAAKKKEDEKQP